MHIVLLMLGAVLEGVHLTGLVTNFRLVYRRFFLVSLLSLIAFWPGEGIYRLESHAIAFVALFALALAVFMSKEILPRIHERTVLLFTGLTWYLLLIKYGFSAIFHSYFFVFLVIATVLVLYAAFVKFNATFFWKLALYIWYLVMMAIIALFVAFDVVIDLYRGSLSSLSLINTFLLGGATVYLLVNIWFVYYLIPIPGKNQAISDRIRMLKEYVQLLVSKYDDYQLGVKESLFWIILMIVLLSANLQYQYFSEILVINLFILMVSITDMLAKAKNN